MQFKFLFIFKTPHVNSSVTTNKGERRGRVSHLPVLILNPDDKKTKREVIAEVFEEFPARWHEAAQALQGGLIPLLIILCNCPSALSKGIMAKDVPGEESPGWAVTLLELLLLMVTNQHSTSGSRNSAPLSKPLEPGPSNL